MSTTVQLDRFSHLLHECPFVFIRSDSIRILWDHAFPNDKLVVNAAAVLKHDPSLAIVKTPEFGQKTPLAAIEVTEKVKHLQQSPPESIGDRVKYLGSPSNYLFEHFHYLYTRVYGPISESVLRKHLAQLCHADVNATKFALPKELWTCNVKWPEWCQGGPSARSTSPGDGDKDGDDFIGIPDDWEGVLHGRSERQLRTLSSPYTRAASPDGRQSHAKRARRELDDRLGEISIDWDVGHDGMDIDDDDSERPASDYTDSRPSTPATGIDVVSIDLLSKMTARRVLNAILERGPTNGASGVNRSDQIDPSKDRTRSVKKRGTRFMAHDFFQPDPVSKSSTSAK
ncbi:hypothetical protein BCR44DRAFT_47482 [Catenaria anguillulae PL171]|uniref:Uncharacterized protein n=1 Tax=Catenaria anguillulae PL171 TaxID=765915 RepID=A0A1Y2HUM8_9FUNG|nr:hypothetical protein BCR44DRAFT_47482 [Catenaria anguillulae PL171]